MGHFGRRPIRLAWFIVVFPALLLNYFGQGALLIADPSAADEPVLPHGAALGAVSAGGAGHVAAVIASQAVISGRLLAHPAGDAARLSARASTSTTPRPQEIGQIYVAAGELDADGGLRRPGARLPDVEQPRRRLRHRGDHDDGHHDDPRLRRGARALGLDASAAGSLTAPVPRRRSRVLRRPTSSRSPHGGWFPLVVGAVMFTIMTTWKTGRRRLTAALKRGELPIERFIGSDNPSSPASSPGHRRLPFPRPGNHPSGPVGQPSPQRGAPRDCGSGGGANVVGSAGAAGAPVDSP